MPNMGSHGHYGPSTPQKRQDLTITVRSRNGSLQTSFCIEDPNAASAHDLASICRQLFRHIAALVRLVLSLCLVPLEITAGTCRYLGKGLLEWLEGRLYNVPRQARLLEDSVKSYMRHRWPRMWEFMHRNMAPLIQLMQKLIDDRDARRRPTSTSAVRGSDAFCEDHFEDIVMVKMTSSSVPSTQFEYTHNRCSWRQISTSPALDDIPSLEELSASNTLTTASYESSSGAKNPHDTGYHLEIEDSPLENPPENEKTAGHDVAAFELGERCPAMSKEIVGRPTDALETRQEIPVGSIRPIQISGDANFDCSWDGTITYSSDVASLHGDKSSPPSEPGSDESFFPIQLLSQRTGRKDTRSDSPHVPINRPQEGHEIEPPLLMPLIASDTPKSQVDETSTIPSSQYAPSTMLGPPSSTPTTLDLHSPTSMEDAGLKATKPAHNSKRGLSDFQAECDTPLYSRTGAGCRHSRTVSCYEEPHAPAIKSARQQTSEADECDETCISCVTCDRRHKRSRRSSKIPRRIKTFEHFRARSYSPSSYRTARSTDSTGTIVRKTLQKRKGKGH